MASSLRSLRRMGFGRTRWKKRSKEGRGNVCTCVYIYIYVRIRKDLCPLVFFSRREVIINIPGLEARIIWSGNRNEENPFSPRDENRIVIPCYVRTYVPGVRRGSARRTRDRRCWPGPERRSSLRTC